MIECSLDRDIRGSPDSAGISGGRGGSGRIHKKDFDACCWVCSDSLSSYRYCDTKPAGGISLREDSRSSRKVSNSYVKSKIKEPVEVPYPVGLG